MKNVIVTGANGFIGGSLVSKLLEHGVKVVAIDISFTPSGLPDSPDLLKLETSLDDLLLAYKIDLTNYHKIKNEELIDHINRVGVLFYEKI